MSRIKQRSEDFRVRELLGEGVLGGEGRWRVYQVIKRRLTSIEAAERLADLAGVQAGEVSMAGMKDRQGITVQHMAVEAGRQVTWRSDDLRIESVGFARDALSPKDSAGNSFEIVVRGLERGEIDRLRANLPLVRELGVVNYFDDQRFGNLRHGQGWIALDLMRGEHEAALKALLCATSRHDDQKHAAFKAALARTWGDWGACRDVAGRFGAHHSVFEHLKRSPHDFAGAFAHISTRLRLIHLYAFQSHVWNRAVAAWVRERSAPAERLVAEGLEGPLVFPAARIAPEPAWNGSFRLPGPRLEDVSDPAQRALLEDSLAAERLVPASFSVEGVSGFQLKGEDRALFVVPRHLRVRPSDPDPLNRGLRLVKLRFELPRGAYATLVVKRLLVRGPHEPREERAERDAGPVRRPQGERSPREHDARRGPDRRGEPGQRSERGPWRGRGQERERGPRRDDGAQRERGPQHEGGPLRDPDGKGERGRSGERGPRPPGAARRGERREDRRGDRRGPPRNEGPWRNA
jgi:tRNA pseudouridine13 synthase